jgi:hypothetical protein
VSTAVRVPECQVSGREVFTANAGLHTYSLFPGEPICTICNKAEEGSGPSVQCQQSFPCMHQSWDAHEHDPPVSAKILPVRDLATRHWGAVLAGAGEPSRDAVLGGGNQPRGPGLRGEGQGAGAEAIQG